MKACLVYCVALVAVLQLQVQILQPPNVAATLHSLDARTIQSASKITAIRRIAPFSTEAGAQRGQSMLYLLIVRLLKY